MPVPARPRRGRYSLHPPADDMTRRRVGDANPRGRLYRDLGPFRLRPELAAPGAIAFGDALDLIVADWDRQVVAGNIAPETPKQYEPYLRGLGALAQQYRMTQVADLTVNFLLMWCQMPHANGDLVTDGTRRMRRAAARSFFETAKALGITDVNPAKSVEFPSRKDRYVRALTDDQIRHLQQHARMTMGDLRTPAALALIMSGASTRELSFVTVDDVDLPNRRVWVHDGGYRQRERWIVLCDDWCVAAVARQVAELRDNPRADPDDRWLIYQPHPTQPTPRRQKDAGGTMILRLMKFARVHRAGVTRAESIREWYAQKVFDETNSLAEVGRRLGMSSLDAVAHLVGYNWLDGEHAATFQPPAHRATTDADKKPDLP